MTGWTIAKSYFKTDLRTAHEDSKKKTDNRL
jgi:hypothetical protein